MSDTPENDPTDDGNGQAEQARPEAAAPTPEAYAGQPPKTASAAPVAEAAEAEPAGTGEVDAARPDDAPGDGLAEDEADDARARRADEALHRAKATVEALLLATDDPVEPSTLQKVLAETDDALVRRAIETLRLDYSGPYRGIHLVEVAGGLQFRTNPDYHGPILALYETRPKKLSRAALETLAIIAYRQPLTRAEVEEIRGVDCSGVIRTLQDHDLVEVVGQLDDIGRPNIYGTTPKFLEFFGLEHLSDLPTLDADELEALEEMYAEELAELEADGEPEGSAEPPGSESEA